MLFPITLSSLCLYALLFISIPGLACDIETRNNLPNGSEPYLVRSSSRKLNDALELFGRNIGIPVEIDGDIQGNLYGYDRVLSRKDYLETLTRDNMLVWYYDCFRIHISDMKNHKIRYLKTKKIQARLIIEIIKKSLFYQSKFSIHELVGTSFIVINSPQSYFNFLEEVANALDESDTSDTVIWKGSRNTATKPETSGDPAPNNEKP